MSYLCLPDNFMASSRLVLEHRSLSRCTSGDSYNCWTGTVRDGAGSRSATRGGERGEDEGERKNGKEIGNGSIAVKVKTS